MNKVSLKSILTCGIARGVVAPLQRVSLHHCKECRCTTARGGVANPLTFNL